MMRFLTGSAFILLASFGMNFSSVAFAKSKSNKSVEVVYEDNSKEDKIDDSFSEPIEQLFKNPVLANGIASGSDAINRSIESLMDSLFYSLLDNELKWNLTSDAAFAIGFRRDLFSTQSGAYVVVDRMSLGPRYSKALGNVAKLPITLGTDGSVEVLQIYLRTDGMRVAEQAELPFWRTAVNNWFGILPLASLMLPPSFNPNELYDPLKQLETPFVFPLSVEAFYEMQVGSIRSYNVSGGISLSLDFAGVLDRKSSEVLESLENLAGSGPYTIFKRGESRINVLRRGEHTAWVGLAKVDRVGHAFDFDVGNQIYVLTGALAATAMDNRWSWVWKGVPGLFYPLDSSYEQSLSDMFDQVYEYDLRNPHAKEAYLAAVNGDFVVSKVKYREAKESNVETGVDFQFTRLQDRNEENFEIGPNLGLFKKSRSRNIRKSEIEITDQKGKFYILQARETLQDRDWDVLVGDEKEKLDQIMEIKVQRIINKEFASSVSDPEAIVFEEDIDPDHLDEEAFLKAPMDGSDKDEVLISEAEEPEDSEKYYYVLSSDGDPIQITLNYNIQDRYTTAEEYSEYLENLRFVSKLPIRDIPKIGFRDQVLLSNRRQKGFFYRPEDSGINQHVVPTYLGRFAAKATMVINTKELNRILNRSDKEMWTAFARAFGKDADSWGDEKNREGLAFQSQWFPAFLALPLRLFNLRFKSIDAIAEITYRIDALKRLRMAEKPLKKLEVAYDLFDTNYPKELMRSLLMLSNRTNVPRKVSLVAKPKGGARHNLKLLFRKANGRVFSAGPQFPEPGRYSRAKKKLAAFYLDQPREHTNKPLLRTLKIGTKKLKESFKFAAGTSVDDIRKQKAVNHAFVKLSVQNANHLKPLQIYVRVEQAGKIKFGKLELAEAVLKLDPLKVSKSRPDRLNYEFYLSGPASPLSNFLYNQVVDLGDDFAVTITVSREGIIWSDSKTFEYHFEGGLLSKPK